MAPPFHSSKASHGGQSAVAVDVLPSVPASPPVLKSKKSLDWLSKSFKRKPSTHSISSDSSYGSGSGCGSSGERQRSGHGHGYNTSGSSNSSGRRTQSSPAFEPLLTIPASPRATYSPPSSVEDSGNSKSGDDSRSNYSNSHFSANTASPAAPLTPDGGRSIGSSPGLAPLSSATSSRQHQQHQQTALHYPPPPSPSYINYNNTPVIPISLTSGRSQSSGLSSSPSTHSSSATKQAKRRSENDGAQSVVAANKREAADDENILVSLSSRKVLRTMLDDPVGLWKFGQFMASEMNAETLVFWLNAEQHRNDLKRLNSLTQRIHSLHIPSNAPLALNITSNERTAIEKSIRAFSQVDDPFKVARDTAFQAIYLDAWPRFLQWRLELLHTKLRQGGLTPPQTSFTLADPSQDRDQPLLLVSDGFLDLSGYSRTDVLMRNCRFLQGAGTAPAVVARIRQACREGTDLTEMLLNYRKDGVPFWSLLRIIPLRNAAGKLKYLLGAQINVTAVLSATPDLAHLLADELDPIDMAPRPPFEHDLAEMQRDNTNSAMRSYLNSLDKQGADTLQKKSEIERRDIANKSLLGKIRSSPMLSAGSRDGNPPNTASTIQPSTGAAVGASASSNPAPAFGANNLPVCTPRPRSGHRDMHLQAAAALAFENSMGSVKPTTAAWTGVPSSAARPTTSTSLFQRPGTAYSMVDTDGKARAQLSLAEQTKAFNDASSYYIVLDSTATTILFHSENLPANIAVGGNFPNLVGTKVSKKIQERISQGERVDLDGINLHVPPQYDPTGDWKRGVKICLTPLKDQINEVGAIIALIS